MSALPPQRSHDICGRVNDAVDLRGQRLKGVQHFVFKGVPVVNAAHAANGVAQAPLGNVAVDASPA
jgi:hypothetical protein